MSRKEKWMIEDRESRLTSGPYDDLYNAEQAVEHNTDFFGGQWTIRRPNRKEKLVEAVTSVVAWIIVIPLFLLMLWLWFGTGIPCAVIAFGC